MFINYVPVRSALCCTVALCPLQGSSPETIASALAVELIHHRWGVSRPTEDVEDPRPSPCASAKWWDDVGWRWWSFWTCRRSWNFDKLLDVVSHTLPHCRHAGRQTHLIHAPDSRIETLCEICETLPIDPIAIHSFFRGLRHSHQDQLNKLNGLAMNVESALTCNNNMNMSQYISIFWLDLAGIIQSCWVWKVGDGWCTLHLPASRSSSSPWRQDPCAVRWRQNGYLAPKCSDINVDQWPAHANHGSPGNTSTGVWENQN